MKRERRADAGGIIIIRVAAPSCEDRLGDGDGGVKFAVGERDQEGPQPWKVVMGEKPTPLRAGVNVWKGDGGYSMI